MPAMLRPRIEVSVRWSTATVPACLTKRFTIALPWLERPILAGMRHDRRANRGFCNEEDRLDQAVRHHTLVKLTKDV